MKPLAKKLLVTLSIVALFGLLFGAFTATNYAPILKQNEFISFLKDKVESYYKNQPEDKIYLQFDKTLYEPGDNIWFTAFIRDGLSLKPSLESDIVHVELINPKGSIEKEIILVASYGAVNGDFKLSPHAPGGIYKVRAYTNYQKNDDTPAFFEKELQVQVVILPTLKMELDFERESFGPGDEVIARMEINTNENKPLSNHPFRYVVMLEGKKIMSEEGMTGNAGMMLVQFDLPKNLKTNDGLLNILIEYEGKTESISRSIPILLNEIEFTLFPEGGDLVEGIESIVAYKALDEFGKPADVEGTVVDEEGNQITEFTSFHHGMGAFSIKPKGGHRYFVHITKPVGIDQVFEVPEALPRGYVLNVDHIDKHEVELKVRSTEDEVLNLVAQVRGKVYFAEAFEAKVGSNNISIDTRDFPMGVAQITLFDSKGIERAERMVFVNKDRQLSIEIETDKDKYLPREKVRMTIMVTDERGMPMPANINLAVVDDQLLTFTDDKSSNILSSLMLESDLNIKVREPKFYFDKTKAKADRALDYLLMTAGWRRFTWKQVLREDLPLVDHQGERAIIAGYVIDYSSGEPIQNALLKVKGKEIQTSTNDEGWFIFNQLDLSEHKNLEITAIDHTLQNLPLTAYSQNLRITLFDQNHVIYQKGAFLFDMEKAAEIMDFQMAQEGGVKFNRRNPAPVLAKKNKQLDVRGDNEPQPLLFKAKDAPPPPPAEPLAFIIADIVVEPVQEIAMDQVIEVDAFMEEADFGFFYMPKDDIGVEEEIKVVTYYRAREFAAPDYEGEEEVTIRNDFRSTIYWEGNIEIDRRGKKVIEFYNSDMISSFKATVEGIGIDGTVGRVEYTFYTQLPFSMYMKVPAEVVMGDIAIVPFTLKNNTDVKITGDLTVLAPDGFESVSRIPGSITVDANDTRTVYFSYKVGYVIAEGEFVASFKSLGLSDAFVQNVKIVPKGFPMSLSFSGDRMKKEYVFDIRAMVDGSLDAKFTAFPSITSDLLSGIESILREPYGCFEQTSTSSFPNVLVLQYLQETESTDYKAIKKAKALLDKGYHKLITFETSEKGYEWFGGAPGHEALSAYGLLQFNEMKKVYDGVDQKMIDRTADWLFARRDGKGGFKKNSRALDTFGRADDDITNAYIVYALTEADYKNVDLEVNRVFERAEKNKDPYQIALATIALYNLGDKRRANKLLGDLLKLQEEDGSWNGTIHSVTRSTGISLKIEATSLAIKAILKSDHPDGMVLQRAIEYLISTRSGHGGFGSTQSTIMALSALTDYTGFAKQTDEDGTIEIYVDGKLVETIEYEAGEKDALIFEGLDEYLTSGKHRIKIKYVGVEDPLPYSVSINWNTTLPAGSKDCVIGLTTKISEKKIKVGETVRLAVELKNLTDEGQPMTMAIIGIPAGLSVQPWQLKEMMEKGVIDFYEISGNKIVCYYREMKPNEIRGINFDLKAEIPGEYEASASCAYLYYTNEYKCWNEAERITITK
ncbi:MAG: hypothetical protein IIA45_01350 [Bacteroidetes bacterium]|nr:hypothetical protein [Bacteroidota bacterium]